VVKSSAYDNYQALMHSRKYQDDFRKYENHCAKVGKFDDIVVGNPYDGNLGTFRKGRSKVGKKEYPLLQVRSLSEAGRALCDRWNLYCPISPFQERSMAEIEGLLHWVHSLNRRRNGRNRRLLKCADGRATVKLSPRSMGNLF